MLFPQNYYYLLVMFIGHHTSSNVLLIYRRQVKCQIADCIIPACAWRFDDLNYHSLAVMTDYHLQSLQLFCFLCWSSQCLGTAQSSSTNKRMTFIKNCFKGSSHKNEQKFVKLQEENKHKWNKDSGMYSEACARLCINFALNLVRTLQKHFNCLIKHTMRTI